MSEVSEQVCGPEKRFNGDRLHFEATKLRIDAALHKVRGFGIATGNEVAEAEPVAPVAGASAAQFAIYNSNWDRWNKRDDSFLDRRGKAYGVITDHMSDNVLRAFSAANGDPAAAYQIFLTFGTSDTSAQDEQYWFSAVTKMKMNQEEFFGVFCPKFDAAKCKAKISDTVATGLLRDAMPERLASEVKHSQMQNQTYAQARAFLNDADNLWHARNPSMDRVKVQKGEDSEDAKKVRRMGKKSGVNPEGGKSVGDFHPEVTCHNCNNVGHYADKCLADFCGYCGEEGHVSTNCEERARCEKKRGKDKDKKVKFCKPKSLSRVRFEEHSSDEDFDDEDFDPRRR